MKSFSFFKDTRVILGVIFLLALFLRTHQLSTLPNGFFTDEVVSGYVGRFTLLHGNDPYGNLFPLFYFDKFGDYRVILPMYITGIATFLFGVNEFAVRFPPAFFGAFFSVVVYFFIKELTKNRVVSLISAFFSAILPWHIVLSRAQSEGIIGLTVFTYALYLLLRSIRTQKINLLLISVVLFALTYFLYPSFRLLSPFVVFSSVLFANNSRWKKIVLVSALTLFLMSLFVLQTKWGGGRFSQTSFFKSEYIAEQIQSSIDSGTSPAPNILVARIFHNKVGAYTREFVVRYFDYFSPSFFFLNGGLPYRYAVPNAGLLYIALAIFFPAIIFVTKSAKDKKTISFLLIILFLAPLPSLITVDDVPNINRALFMILPLVAICAYGAVSLYQASQRFKTVFLVLFSVLLLAEMAYFYNQYAYQARSVKGFLRGDQYRELVQFMVKEHSNHPKIYAFAYETLPVYYAFYSNNFDSSLAGRFKYGLTIDQIDNVVFIKDVCPARVYKKNFYEKGSLIVQNSECISDEGFRLVKTFTRHDGTEAFKILAVD